MSTIFYNLIGNRIEAIFEYIFVGSTEEGSLNTRIGMIVKGFEIFNESPLFGYGLDSFRLISNYNTYSHNNYVEILVSSGIIGFCLYYIPLFILLIKTFRSYKKNRERLCALMFVIILLKLLLDFFLVSYFERMDLFLYIMAYSYLQILGDNKTNEKNQKYHKESL